MNDITYDTENKLIIEQPPMPEPITHTPEDIDEKIAEYQGTIDSAMAVIADAQSRIDAATENQNVYIAMRAGYVEAKAIAQDREDVAVSPDAITDTPAG